MNWVSKKKIKKIWICVRRGKVLAGSSQQLFSYNQYLCISTPFRKLQPILVFYLASLSLSFFLLLTHPLTHSLTHSLAYSFIRSFSIFLLSNIYFSFQNKSLPDFWLKLKVKFNHNRARLRIRQVKVTIESQKSITSVFLACSFYLLLKHKWSLYLLWMLVLNTF